MHRQSNFQRIPLFMLQFDNQAMAGQNRDCTACSVVITKMPSTVEHHLRKRRYIQLTDADVIAALQQWNATSPKRAKIDKLENKMKANCACPPVRKMPYLQGGSICISAMCRALQSVYMQQLSEKRKQKYDEAKRDSIFKDTQKLEDARYKKISQATEEKHKKSLHLITDKRSFHQTADEKNKKINQFKEINQIREGKSKKAISEDKNKKTFNMTSEKLKKVSHSSDEKQEIKRENKMSEEKYKKESKFLEDKKQKTQQAKENKGNVHKSLVMNEKVQPTADNSKQKVSQQKKERNHRDNQQKREGLKSQKSKPIEQVQQEDLQFNLKDNKTKEVEQINEPFNISESNYAFGKEKDIEKISTKDNIINQIDNLKDNKNQMTNTMPTPEEKKIIPDKQAADNSISPLKSSRIIPIPGAISTPISSEPSANLPNNSSNSYNFYSAARSVNHFENTAYQSYWNHQQVIEPSKKPNNPYPIGPNGQSNPNCWYNNVQHNSSSHGNSNFTIPYMNNIWTQNQHHILREKFHFGNHMNIANEQNKIMRPHYRGPTNIQEMWNGSYNRNFPPNCEGPYRMGMSVPNYIGSSGMRPRSDCIWTQNAMMQSPRNTFSGNRYVDCNKMVPNLQNRPISRASENNTLKTGIPNKIMSFLNREVQLNIPSIMSENENRKSKEFDKMMSEIYSEGPNFSSPNRAKTTSSLTPINHLEEGTATGGTRELSESFQSMEYNEMCFTRGHDILSRAIESALILGDMDEEAVLRMDQEAHLMELDHNKNKNKSEREKPVLSQKDEGKTENKNKIVEKTGDSNDNADLEKSLSLSEANSTEPKVLQEDDWERRVALEEVLERLINDVCHLERCSSVHSFKDSLNGESDFPSQWEIYERDVDESSCNTDLPLRLSPTCDSDYDIEPEDFVSYKDEKTETENLTDQDKGKTSSISSPIDEEKEEIEQKDEEMCNSNDKSEIVSEETKSIEESSCNQSNDETLDESDIFMVSQDINRTENDSDISNSVNYVMQSLITACVRLCEENSIFEPNNKNRISLKFSMRMLRQMEQTKHVKKLAKRFRKMSLMNMSRKRQLDIPYEEGSLDSLDQKENSVLNLQDQPRNDLTLNNRSLTESVSDDTNLEEDPEAPSTPSSSSDVPSLLCHAIIDNNYIIKSIVCKEGDVEIKCSDQSDVEAIEEVMESLVQNVEKLSRLQGNQHNSSIFKRTISMDMVDKLAKDVGREFQFQPDETESFKESARKILLRENSTSTLKKKKRKVVPLKIKMKMASPRESEMNQDGTISQPCILQQKIRLRRQKKNDELEGMLTRMRSLRHRGGNDIIAVDFEDPLPVEYRVRRTKRSASSSQSIERIVLSKKIMQRNIPGKIHKRSNNKQSDRRQRKRIRRKKFPHIEKIFMIRSRKTKMDNACTTSALDLSFKRVEVDDDSELGPKLVIDESSFAELEQENTSDSPEPQEDSPVINGPDQPLNLSNKKTTNTATEIIQPSVVPQRNTVPRASPLVADPAPIEVAAQEPAKQPSPSSSPVFIKEVIPEKKPDAEEVHSQEQMENELPRITNVVSLANNAFEAVGESVKTPEPQLQVTSVQTPQSIQQKTTTPPAAPRLLPSALPPTSVHSTSAANQQTQQQLQDRDVFSAQYEKLKKELATLEVVALIKERERNNILRLKQYKQAIMRKLQLRQMLIHSNAETNNNIKTLAPNVIASSTLGAPPIPAQSLSQKQSLSQQPIISQQSIIQQQSSLSQQPIIQQQPVLQQQPIISTSAIQATGLNSSQLNLPQLYVSAAPIPTVVRVAPSMMNPALSAGHQILPNQHATTAIVTPNQAAAGTSQIMVAGKPMLIPKAVNDRNQGLSNIETVVSNARQNFGLQLQGWMDDGQGLLLPLFQTTALTSGKVQPPIPSLQGQPQSQPTMVQRVDAATSTNSAQDKQLVKKRISKTIDEIIQSVYTRNLKHVKSPPSMSTHNSKTPEAEVQTNEATVRSPVMHHQVSTNSPLAKPAALTEPKPRSQLAQLLMNPAINQREPKDLGVTTVLSTETKSNPKFPHGGTAMVTSNAESEALSKDSEKIKFTLDRLKRKWPMCRGCLVRQARFVCAGCSNQWYCSIPCQVKNWKQHFKMCHR